MTLKEKLQNGIFYLDGAMGTTLQSLGLKAGELPEEWNLSRPDDITAIHRAYFLAGSDMVLANTFGANPFKFGGRTEQIVRAAIRNAKSAAAEFKDKFVALDIGSLGKLLKPLGSLGFEDAVSAFKPMVRAGADAGADAVVIETMNDGYEMKAAVVAAKEECDLPIFATFVFGNDQKTMTGLTPEAAVALCEGLGVCAVGLNCSLAPAQMTEVVKRMLKVASVPVIVKPNAGLPEVVGGKTAYSLGADGFAEEMKAIAMLGATVLGGCCGTTPEYIKALVKATEKLPVNKIENKRLTVISSYTKACYFGDIPVLIGERINPTGKKRLKQALKENDLAYILGEAVAQEENGAHVLDVNVGLPEIDEAQMLENAVTEIQAVTALPLQIDTSSVSALERAMRVYNGKPLVNSVNGEAESMQAVFPLVKKYGGAVIALTLDENGIPPTAEGRIKIAEKIIKTAEEYGIGRNELIFDTLAMAVSADPSAALAAIDALRYIRHTIGCNTSLGVSNISFGLPQRDFINSTFFAMALNAGLSAAIINPNSQEMIKTYKSYLALTGKDEGFKGYIDYAAKVTSTISVTGSATAETAADKDLKYYIVKGMKSDAAKQAEILLKSNKPLDVVNGFIIPALNDVGKGFEQKTVFLPQLLMSAEAATAAFGEVKRAFDCSAEVKKLNIVIATVEGDIHDIGKNIVKTLLENYGFKVYDLGKDVPCEKVAEAAVKYKADLVGLSALMTTTVVSMERTIKLLRRDCPECKVCVGGAVLNKEYADAIGADEYCKDAMETVRYAERLENEKTGRS